MEDKKFAKFSAYGEYKMLQHRLFSNAQRGEHLTDDAYDSAFI
jgi:hypothetical protein